MRFLNFYFGRGGEIRTHGLLYPKQARYQTAPRPDNMLIIDDTSEFVNYKLKVSKVQCCEMISAAYPWVTTRILVTPNALEMAGIASRRMKVRCSSLSATIRQRSPATLMLWIRLIRRSNSASPSSSRSTFRPGINWGFSLANRFSIGEKGTVTTRASRATTKFSSFSPGTTKSGLILTSSSYLQESPASKFPNYLFTPKEIWRITIISNYSLNVKEVKCKENNAFKVGLNFALQPKKAAHYL